MNTQTVNEIQFKPVARDINGNPRYVCHFVNLLKEGEKGYDVAVRRAHQLGGRKFDNKQFGGGIVFQSYNVRELSEQIIAITK